MKIISSNAVKRPSREEATVHSKGKMIKLVNMISGAEISVEYDGVSSGSSGIIPGQATQRIFALLRKQYQHEGERPKPVFKLKEQFPHQTPGAIDLASQIPFDPSEGSADLKEIERNRQETAKRDEIMRPRIEAALEELRDPEKIVKKAEEHQAMSNILKKK